MSALAEDTKPQAPAAGFADTVTAAALGMRRALADFVAAVPGSIRRPRELQYALELDYRLSWCVFHVISATNILGAANQVPNPSSIRRLVDRGEKKGVAASVLQALVAASEEFQRVVLIHARDRASFDAMVAGVSAADGKSQIDLVERRTAFRVNAHIWGSQTETQAVGFFVRKSQNGQGVDECCVTTRLGLQRVRPGARTIAYRYEMPNPLNPGSASVTEVPLDPDSQRIYGASLIPEFCTQPLPHFKKEVAHSLVTYEFQDDDVGLRSAVDLTVGSVMRNLAPKNDAKGRRITYYSMTFRTPVARFHLDLLIHRPSFGKITPELLIIGTMTSSGVPPIDVLPSELLPVRAEIVPVEGGVACAHTPQAPRHADVLRYACNALEWDPAEFDVYRVFMEYPVLHSTVRVQFAV